MLKKSVHEKDVSTESIRNFEIGVEERLNFPFNILVGFMQRAQNFQ